MTGLPATAAHWFPRPRGSERQSPANAQRCRQLGGPPGSCLHARPTRTALAEETSRLSPALAASASVPCLLARGPAHPLAGPGDRGCQGGRGGAGFPPLSSPPYPTPHVGPALRKAWTPPATAPALGSAPTGGAAPGHAWAGTGGLRDEGWARGVPSQVVPGVSPGQDRGNTAPRLVYTLH